MMRSTRYALYYAPEPGAFADRAAALLGWDAGRGSEVLPPDLIGLPRPLADITAAPGRYGFHGTVKPPFRLAAGQGLDALDRTCAAFCARHAPVALLGLRLDRIGGFLALTPEGDAGPLVALAAQAVRMLDPFRAPLTPAEIARRRPDRLTEAERRNLALWGYPYVMEAFRFHLTLTGELAPDEIAPVEAALGPYLWPVLPRPFVIADLCLFGEAADGRFHLLHRYPLTG